MGFQKSSTIENFYLNRYGTNFKPFDISPCISTKVIITIPCYNEENLIATLDSLENCQFESEEILVLILINAGEDASRENIERNQKSLLEFEGWNSSKRTINYTCRQINNLPKKHAGVGLARKILMDEAVRLFEQTTIGDRGLIVCLDADTLVAPNYLQTLIEETISSDYDGFSIHYEHPYEEDLEPTLKEGIIGYELHLRYYINALRFTGFPYAHQTIGSSMASRSYIYQKQGGMPKRKAGEDFYFLNKIIPFGKFKNITSTYTLPSCRVSQRVPFGTGKAQEKWIEKEEKSHTSYNFYSFPPLKTFFSNLSHYYEDRVSGKDILKNLSLELVDFLRQEEFELEYNRITKQGKSIETFKKSFFQWFDAFKCMKYVHFMRDHYYPDSELVSSCNTLLKEEKKNFETKEIESMLLYFRQWDKNEQ